jgi:splicing factor 3A subunit 3
LIDGADGWKKEEMDILQGVGRREGDVWDSFYDRLKEIKDYHRKISQGHTLPQVSTNKVNYHLV